MGLSISNPSTTVNSKLLVGKSNTAVEASLGSASVTGANAGTSSYGEISASLSAATLLTQVVTVASANNFAANGLTYVDLAYGAAASETVIASVPLITAYDGTFSRLAIGRLVIPARVASGQRLAVRITSSNDLHTTTVTLYVFGATYANTEGN